MKTLRMLCLMVVCALLLPLLPAAAETRMIDPIQVGWYSQPGYMEQITDAETGEVAYTGYCYAFLENIARYTGWKYEFVEGDFATLYEKLVSGEIDVLPMMYTEERAAEVRFPHFSSGSVYSTLFVREGSDVPANIPALYDGMKIGTQLASVHSDSLGKYAEENGFHYKPYYYASADDVLAAVKNGEIDAGVIGGMRENNEVDVIARFQPVDFYFAATKHDILIISQLNAALEAIKINDSNYIAKLEEEYLRTDDVLMFSQEETEYLRARTKPVRFGVLPDRYPVCYVDEETGEVSGILKDITDAVAEYADLTVEYVVLDAVTFQGISEQDVDFAAGAYRTEARLSDPELVLTDTVFSTHFVAVAKKGANLDEATDRSCAVLNSERAIYSQLDFNFAIHEYQSSEACMKAVAEDDVAVAIVGQYVADYYLQMPQYNDLSVLNTYEKSFDICYMAGVDIDKELVSIINKCIAAVTEDELNTALVQNTTAKPYELTRGDVLYAYRHYIAVVVISCVIIFTLLLIMNQSHRRHIATLRAANEHLAIAIEQAERASAIKSEFTSRISHEIRTPLNIVLGNIAMAKNAGGNYEKVQDCLTKSEASAKQLLGLLNEVLDQSSLENGKLQLAQEKFSLRDMLCDLSSTYYEQGQQKGVRFDVNITTVLTETLIGDSLRLNQVLMNLLSNAMKFTPRGGRISLTVTQLTASAQRDQLVLRFVVSDTGIGIRPEFIDRLFDPYEQADSAIARQYGGSGLGLSITKQLVTLMNGAIHVSSREKMGTVFTVELPFAPAEEPKPDVTALASLRVLLVAKDGVDVLRTMIEQCGASVSVSSFAEAADVVKRDKQGYQICMIDSAVHDGGAAEVLRTAIGILRQTESNKPLIAAMAYDNEIPEYAAENSGVDVILHKPVFPSDLYSFFAELCDVPMEDGTEEQAEHLAPTENNYVLLVEDNDLNQELMYELLVEGGYRCDCAENGKEAVEMFCKNPMRYCAILMDVQMPVMDGYEATQRIRDSAHPRGKTVPVIAMTANAGNSDITRAFSAGMDDYLTKPVDINLLYRSIGKYAGGDGADGKGITRFST